MVFWTLLSGIQFNQLSDDKVTEKGLLAALLEFEASDLLGALDRGLREFEETNPPRAKRRRLNQDRGQLEATLGQLAAPGGNALGHHLLRCSRWRVPPLGSCPFTSHWQSPMSALRSPHCTTPISRGLIYIRLT